MKSSLPVAYALRPDATPEAETNALANVYRFILDCRTKKEAATESRPDDAERRSNEIGANRSIPR